MVKWKLKRHESFQLREGWFEKALDVINEEEKVVFSKDSGIKLLGVGSNMVKAIRFWMLATGLIDNNNNLTDLAKTLIKYDPYLEDDFSWWILHANLVTNYEELPVFNIIFNKVNSKRFTKDSLIEIIKDFATDENIDDVNYNLVAEDVSVFLRTYIGQEIINPEDNLSSPFSRLEIVEEKERNYYSFISTSHEKLHFLAVYYSLSKVVKDSINAEDLFEMDNSPAKIFKLDKNQFYSYLNDMKNNNLITLNRTAGLNMIYLDKTMKLTDIFKSYFKGGK